ncbi:MAG: hypothetical protein O3B47_02595 [bacterium]|nr:hypothetical protein [bacterium]
MPILKAKLNKEEGFVSIIALGIFALLAVFGIIIQQTVVDTFQSVKNSNNYYAARDIADSTMERLQLELNKYDLGYNITSIHCEFLGGTAVVENDPLCADILGLVDLRDVKVDLEIKGRSENSENLVTSECKTGVNLGGNINTCYTVPFPGNGEAGTRCNMYEPVLGNSGSQTVPTDIITGGNQANIGLTNVDQLDYSCNWNKLSFGSSLTDRVAIPLYYDDGTNIQNPFNEVQASGVGQATELVLRIRPPCKPCFKAADQPPDTRSCDDGQDESVCVDSDRYVLNTDDNEIIVQWNLTGLCENSSGEIKECGLISDPNSDYTINEEKVNTSKYHVLDKDSTGIITSVHPQAEGTMITDITGFQPQLPKYEKPILNLYLNEALISENNNNIPYLEYQVYTDKPIANPKTKINVIVNVDGNVFTKTLFKENTKSIIDFAIQN